MNGDDDDSSSNEDTLTYSHDTISRAVCAQSVLVVVGYDCIKRSGDVSQWVASLQPPGRRRPSSERALFGMPFERQQRNGETSINSGADKQPWHLFKRLG